MGKLKIYIFIAFCRSCGLFIAIMHQEHHLPEYFQICVLNLSLYVSPSSWKVALMGPSAVAWFLLVLLSYITTIFPENYPTVFYTFKQNNWKVQISTSYISERILSSQIRYHFTFKYVGILVLKLPCKEKNSLPSVFLNIK